ncbi:unnamed protein product [Blepharisma stoltei]|uniref:Uncharacterized protein n=1 Tax=Blepharisma stoltei TaxID=1481888 RepID=A0AAU9K0A5_9CILI|nr:unnamed protein product [Blepharisma stoltei]
MAKYVKSADTTSALERKLEKIEHLLHLSDEMNKLRQEQEESKFKEINRRIEDFDKRLRRVEEYISHSLIDVEHKVEDHEIQLGQVQEFVGMKADLEDLKFNFYTDDRLIGLEKEISSKMMKMCETMEEIAGNLNNSEKEVENLKREIDMIRNEPGKENLSLRMNNLKDQVEELWKRQNVIFQHIHGELMYSEENLEEEEEVFLSKLKT